MGVVLGNLAYLIGMDLILVLREGPAIFEMVEAKMFTSYLPSTTCRYPSPRLPNDVLFLLDFLQRLQALLALGMEDQDALFHYFALLALTSVAALCDQRLFLLSDLLDDFL
jgi:hypothetical protein